MRCHSCEIMVINGVRTHEHGCPDAWRDEVRECLECGSEFEPERREQVCCDESCALAYAGLSEDVDDDEGEGFAFTTDYEDGADCYPEPERPASHY